MTKRFPDRARYRLLATCLLAGGVWGLPVPAGAAVTKFLEAYKDGAAGVNGLAGATRLASSPDARHVYVTGRTEAALTVFARGGDGRLTAQQVLRDGVGGVDGISGAYGVALSPDGLNVYVTGSYESAVAVFARDPSSGSLAYLGKRSAADGTPGLASASGLVVSPDGNHVYAGSAVDDAVVVFSRAAGGHLTYVEMHKDEVGATTALDQVEAVTVSPDGAHVYAAALRDHSITVFARSPLTGRLAFVERQGAGGGHGLGGAADVAVSPDGAHVYAVGYLDWTVSVFTRNAGTGALSFVQVHTGGPGGLADLAGPTGLALSPDGSRAYVASATADSLLIFTRDGASGALAFREARRDGDDGVDGLDAVLSVAVAPDDATVYTAALADNSAAAFAVLVFGDGFDSGTLSAWSAAATDTGDLMADGSAAQAGTSWGLRASVDDTAALYVQDDSPQGEARYRARFYLDPDDYDPGEASGHFRTRLFLAFAEPNRRVMALVLRRRGGQYALIARLRRDDGTQADAALPLGDGPRLLEVEWSRASAEAAADGSLTLWMDGVPQLTLGGVDNDQAGVDFVRLGALNVKPGAAGVLRFDEFESRRLQYIGPP